MRGRLVLARLALAGAAPVRFSPTVSQLALGDALLGAAAYSLAMLLRFADEGAVPPTYAARLLPWALLAAAIHLAAGVLLGRVRKPGSAWARRPLLPFLALGAGTLGMVLLVNYTLLPLSLRLPLSVAVVAPLLASAASTALRLMARHEISADELLHRQMVELDVDACASALRGKRVLITGAAGSIGSELARQVGRVGPSELLLLDSNETGLYELEAELRARFPHLPMVSVMANVADAAGIAGVFRARQPQVVFHAAAYKHVPLVEANPDQGFVTNVLGTLAVCEAAVANGVERVVVISTDKAVNPTSFMGLTKRTAELIVAALGARQQGTVLSAVRFGNVLGSRGSVVPMFLRQIELGGPLTITHADVKRFFMTISEAASLVLRSAAFGQAGAVFVLDMGEEMRIVELAERLVRLKGLRPGRDVPFVFTGLRPGEKLREELAGDGETLVPTDHPRVRRVASDYAVDGEQVLAAVVRLRDERRAGTLQAEELPSRLRALIEQSVQSADVLAASAS